jgi:hypothetical protein
MNAVRVCVDDDEARKASSPTLTEAAWKAG